jgi:hypothetical protein
MIATIPVDCFKYNVEIDDLFVGWTVDSSIIMFIFFGPTMYFTVSSQELTSADGLEVWA